MVSRLLRRVRRPSLPTAISLLALSIVLTGTAFAATGQLVNIVDGSNPANVAKVDSTGQLKTAAAVTGTVGVTGNVGVLAPAKPWFNMESVFPGGTEYALTPATT